MKLAVKIAAALIVLSALGFCVAFVAEEVARRAYAAAIAPGDHKLTAAGDSAEAANAESTTGRAAAAQSTGPSASDDSFIDTLLSLTPTSARYHLERELASLDAEGLQDRFFDLMSRDLEAGRAAEYAGLVLQAIASRSPAAAVALLSALTPAEREKLAPAVARGWVAFDPESAFDWIDSAWVYEEGSFIDRAIQNRLYVEAMDVLLADSGDYASAARLLDSLIDPELKTQLTALIARRAVADGPEVAMERLAILNSDTFDASIMHAITEEWASRDSEGAMRWSLVNQEDVASSTARSIAKQLLLAERRASLAQFHQELIEPIKRDNVAAEAARLLARREPVASADWALAIESPSIKTDAVLAALYEIGYESFTQSVDYIDTVYRPDEPARSLVLHSTLRHWLPIDPPAVADYLASPRARLAPELTRDLLR